MAKHVSVHLCAVSILQGEHLSFCKGNDCAHSGEQPAVLRSTSASGLTLTYSWFSSAGAQGVACAGGCIVQGVCRLTPDADSMWKLCQLMIQLSPHTGDAIGMMYGMHAAWRSVCVVGQAAASQFFGDVLKVDIEGSAFLNNTAAGDGEHGRSMKS